MPISEKVPAGGVLCLSKFIPQHAARPFVWVAQLCMHPDRRPELAAVVETPAEDRP
jgi:hypothetical protein